MNLCCEEHPEQTKFYKVIRTRTWVHYNGHHLSRDRRRLKEHEKGVKQTMFICPICEDLIEIIPHQKIDEEPHWEPLKRVR